MIVKIQEQGNSTAGAGGCFKGSEARGNGLQNSGPQGEEMKLSLAPDVDKPRRLKLFDVVRERRGGDGKGRPRLGTIQGEVGLCDPLQ